jgi:hypothetical protein
MRLSFGVRSRKGFFLRAEDFFNFVKRVAMMQEDMSEELKRVEEENVHRSEFAKQQARMAYASSLSALNSRYGMEPDGQSHGESFLAMFRQRIRSGGIYLLDEPEAPLSPMRQLALVSLLMEREEDSQFFIATHSPILMVGFHGMSWPAAGRCPREVACKLLEVTWIRVPDSLRRRSSGAILQNGLTAHIFKLLLIAPGTQPIHFTLRLASPLYECGIAISKSL